MLGVPDWVTIQHPGLPGWKSVFLVEEGARSQLLATVTEWSLEAQKSISCFHHMAGDDLAVSDHEQDSVGRHKDTGSRG